jgi:hypothetical protein
MALRIVDDNKRLLWLFQSYSGVIRLKRVLGLFVSLFVCLFETGSYYVAQAGLKLMILLPQHPKEL